MSETMIWNSVRLPVKDPVPAPEDVGPGWVAAVVFVLLFVVTILLWMNMRKQLGRIRFPEDEDHESEPDGRAAASDADTPGRRGTDADGTGGQPQPPTG